MHWSCTLTDPSCDGSTLVRPFTEIANHTCGYERVACPNGCDATASPPRCR
jgi:hypothetical protein